MQKLLFLAALSLTACASQKTERVPSSAQNEALAQIKNLLPEGQYKGQVPGQNVGCLVQANYGMQFNITATREDFNFQRGDKGSETCMYTQACFMMNFGTDILESDVQANKVDMEINTKAGETGSARKMELGLEKAGNKLLVKVREAVGIFKMGSSSVICEINPK
jgi:hypothetical protein